MSLYSTVPVPQRVYRVEYSDRFLGRFTGPDFKRFSDAETEAIDALYMRSVVNVKTLRVVSVVEGKRTVERDFALELKDHKAEMSQRIKDGRN